MRHGNLVRHSAITVAKVGHFHRATRHAGEEGSGIIDPGKLGEDATGCITNQDCPYRGGDQHGDIVQHLAGYGWREIQTERHRDQ